MTSEQTLPVIVGVAQLSEQHEDPIENTEPLELMEHVLRDAAQEAGTRKLLEIADALYVIRGVWPYRNPAAWLEPRIGASRAKLLTTPFGGNFVQSCINHAARAIAAGELEVALLVSAENGYAQARARKLGVELRYSDTPDSRAERIAPEKPMVFEVERARGIAQPIQLYPIFESALRHAAGESIDAHRARIAALWSRFSDVAATNPHAALRQRYTPQQIASATPDNRMIGFPYTKRLCSNSSVNQAAALVLCSTVAARRHGIPREKWIYLHAGTDGSDTDSVSERWDLHSSPAIRVAGRRALELAGKSADEIAHVDLYSCFPSAVQVAAAELGLSQERPLTVTGGLTFAGGPLNSYVMHSVATMVERLRDDAGAFGLVTANGGFLTKHAFGVYSSEPAKRFAYANVQSELDTLPRREARVNAAGAARVEGYTVMYDGDDPAIAHVACLLQDGARTWACSTDTTLLHDVTREELCGREVSLDGAGGLHPR